MDIICAVINANKDPVAVRDGNRTGAEFFRLLMKINRPAPREKRSLRASFAHYFICRFLTGPERPQQQIGLFRIMNSVYLSSGEDFCQIAKISALLRVGLILPGHNVVPDASQNIFPPFVPVALLSVPHIHAGRAAPPQQQRV